MRIRSLGIALPLLAGLLVFGASQTAEAAKPKRFRLGVDTEFIGFTHFNPDGGDREDNVNTFGFGVARLTPADQATPVPILGLSFGYVFLQDRAIVGAKAAFGVTANSQPETEGGTTAVGGQLVPYFRWVFLPGKVVRPYIEGHVGVGGGAVTTEFEIADELVTSTGHVIYPVVGAGGGVHLFVTDAVSIDVGGGFDYFPPHTRRTSSETVPDDEQDWSKAGDTISFGVLAGISAWF